MQVTGNVIERSIEGPTRAKIYAFGQGWTITVAGEDFASIKCGSFYRITLEEVCKVSQIDFQSEAGKLMSAHFGHMATASSDHAAMQAGIADILKQLVAAGFDWSKILQVITTVMPLIAAGNWWGAILAVIQLFTQNPVKPTGPTLP